MPTAVLFDQVDAVWNAFWSGGISNPLEVMEQFTYLLFIRDLDKQGTHEERNADGRRNPGLAFPDGRDDKGRSYADYQWQKLRELPPSDMFKVVAEHIFPFLRSVGEARDSFAVHMKDARFTIPTPALLQKVVGLIDNIAESRQATQAEVYEYMLSKLSASGHCGQFRTPRHIIDLMVEMTKPSPEDLICDPAAGTCGFLVAAAEHVRRQYPEATTAGEKSRHFHRSMFHGCDFDRTMQRIGSMNLKLHGVQKPQVSHRNSLGEPQVEDYGRYSLILSNPPFAGSLDYEWSAADLLHVVKTKKTELLFLALCLKLLKSGGRAAVIVPDGVLFGSSKAHRQLRQALVENYRLDAILSLPGGVFRPYTGVSTCIVLLTKPREASGVTDKVWFYRVEADGWSLDDKRRPLMDNGKLGCRAVLSDEEHQYNNLPDVLMRWNGTLPESVVQADQQSTYISLAEIRANDYELSPKRYVQRGAVAQVIQRIGHTVAPLGRFVRDSKRASTRSQVVEGNQSDIFISRVPSVPVSLSPENGSSWFRVSIDSEMALPQYLAHFLNSEVGRLSRQSRAKGTTVSLLSLSDIHQLPIPDLPLVDQAAIVSAAGLLANTEAAVLGTLSEIREIRDQLVLGGENLKPSLLKLEELRRATSGDFSEHARKNLFSWMESLPFPLASILRAYQASPVKDNKTQYEHLLKFFEATAQYLGLVTLSGFYSDPAFFQQYREKYLKSLSVGKLSLERATFGTWKVTLEFFGAKIRELLRSQPDKLAALFEDESLSLPRALSHCDLPRVLSQANTWRNEWTGHGGRVGAAGAEERKELLLGKVEELREILNDIWDQSHLVQGEFAIFRAGIVISHANLLVGSNSEFLKKELPLEQGLEEGQLYVVSSGAKRALKLLPLVKIGAVPDSANNACYFYSKTVKGSYQYVSYHYADSPPLNDSPPELRSFLDVVSPSRDN